MDNELIRKIDYECREQFQFEEEIRNVVQNDIVNKMNEYINSVKTDEKQLLITKAITFLSCQGIRNYNSSMLLIRYGYATNALVNLRQMVEIILEIDYILENKNETYSRALKYFTEGNKISKWKKSQSSFNTRLYKAYEVLCDHSHANSNALCKNNIENMISINPNDVLVKETSLFVNSIFYYLLESILKYYKINKEIIDNINVPQNIKDEVSNYAYERDMTNLIFDEFLKYLGLTDEEISKEKESFKNYKKEKGNNKNSGSRKKKCSRKKKK